VGTLLGEPPARSDDDGTTTTRAAASITIDIGGDSIDLTDDEFDADGSAAQ